MSDHRGYFGLAMYHPKNRDNWGSLIRTANILGADFIATIGKRFKEQHTDTTKAHLHLPVFEYKDFDDFHEHLPEGCQLVGLELDSKARDLKGFVHPSRAVYLVGAEDSGIPQEVLKSCQYVIKLKGDYSMNVAVAGSIVLYHRVGL
jgi:tRNA G18 (ribose-2'-O)-methylase SpoU